MPRIARRDYNTSFFHVMVQGIRKEFVFNDKDEFSGICFCLFEVFIAVINCLSMHKLANDLNEFCLSISKFLVVHLQVVFDLLFQPFQLYIIYV